MVNWSKNAIEKAFLFLNGELENLKQHHLWQTLSTQIHALYELHKDDLETFANECPLVSQIKSLVHLFYNDLDSAQQTTSKFIRGGWGPKIVLSFLLSKLYPMLFSEMLDMVGFTADGIRKGSVAADLMRFLGPIPLISKLQHFGVKGFKVTEFLSETMAWLLIVFFIDGSILKPWGITRE